MKKFSLGACAHHWLLSSVEVVEVLALASILCLCSCENVDITEHSSDEGLFTIETTMTPSNVWTLNTPTATSRASADAKTCCMYYIFNSDGNAISNSGKVMNDNTARDSYSITFTNINSAGTYTIYGIFNIIQSEWTSVKDGVTMTTDQTFTLTEPRDVCLGAKQFTIKADTINYNVNVTVSHIMAKLALSVKNVPADIDTVIVALPKESNVFNFKGGFSGSSQTDTLSVVRASAANTDGTYDWSVLSQGSSEEIVFPCTLSSMPISIIAKDKSRTYTFNTQTSYVCTSGSRTSISTTWPTIDNARATVTINPWTGTQQTGTFDMGTPTIK